MGSKSSSEVKNNTPGLTPNTYNKTTFSELVEINVGRSTEIDQDILNYKIESEGSNLSTGIR